MARGQRKTLEEKIKEKEDLISALQTRMKSEQNELEDLYREKKLKDLEFVHDIIQTSGLSPNEVTEALESYARLKEQKVS